MLFLTVRPSGVMRIGPQLLQWFIYSLVISVFAGYVAESILPIGTDYLRVFQIVGTTAFLGYAGALVQQSIWYGRSWSHDDPHHARWPALRAAHGRDVRLALAALIRLAGRASSR